MLKRIYLPAPSLEYLYVGAHGTGINLLYASGIISRIFWWYESLKDKFKLQISKK